MEIQVISCDNSSSNFDSVAQYLNHKFIIIAFAGSSQKEAARIASNVTMTFFQENQINAKDLVEGNDKIETLKGLIVQIKEALNFTIKKKTQLDTLIVFIINRETKKMRMLHIGGGIFMQLNHDETIKQLSYPCYKMLHSKTYSIFDKNILKDHHYHWLSGTMQEDKKVIICSDCLINPFSTAEQYRKAICNISGMNNYNILKLYC